ncbi:MAG: hypothetical protein JSS14_22490 [Proteobacteria bacterium]|nr:hypothetical protein [Pseudomonadota bacterium]
MTTQATSTARPFGFGFNRAPAAAPAQPTAAPAPAWAAPLEASSQGQVPAADVATTREPTGEIERLTIMLPSGGREGQVFGGVFGKMVGTKFQTDELLKRIYLLQLVDGSEPGEGIDQARRDVMAATGGMPETVTISVPVEILPAMKATLAHLSGARWEQLFERVIETSNPMTKFALANEARIAKEAVAQITQTGGELFTVQIAAPSGVRFTAAQGDYDYEDDEYFHDSGLVALPHAVEGDIVTSAAAGYVAPQASGHDVLAAAYQGRQAGDNVAFQNVQLFTVIAGDAVTAQRVLALIPTSLKQPTAQTVTDVFVNGQAFVHTQPLLDDEGGAGDVPR